MAKKQTAKNKAAKKANSLRYPQNTRGNWIVKIRQVVITEIEADNCTKEEAWENPWMSNGAEFEIDMIDYEVLEIRKNE